MFPIGRSRIGADQIVLVHSSLSSIGWVCGGAEAVIGSLLDTLGSTGTLVMPSHSSHLSDPALWADPPVPKTWIEPIRTNMPVFNSALTATRGIGWIPEVFRGASGVLRSSHPMMSFCALGPKASYITKNQTLDYPLGEGSPLARLYELDARVLLIGCGYDCNTSMHLAEYRADWPGKAEIDMGTPYSENGTRIWKIHRDLDIDSDDFNSCGREFEESGRAGPGVFRRGKIGLADSRLMSQRAIVDYAAEWFSANRGLGIMRP